MPRIRPSEPLNEDWNVPSPNLDAYRQRITRMRDSTESAGQNAAQIIMPEPAFRSTADEAQRTAQSQLNEYLAYPGRVMESPARRSGIPTCEFACNNQKVTFHLIPSPNALTFRVTTRRNTYPKNIITLWLQDRLGKLTFTRNHANFRENDHGLRIMSPDRRHTIIAEIKE